MVASVAQVGKALLPNSHGCWWRSVPCELPHGQPRFLAGYWLPATLVPYPMSLWNVAAYIFRAKEEEEIA